MPTLREQVDAIPGDAGFWKSSSRDTFLEAAEFLVSIGVRESAACAFLSQLYVAVSAEYGD